MSYAAIHYEGNKEPKGQSRSPPQYMSRMFYVHYTMHTTYSFTPHLKDAGFENRRNGLQSNH